jgi:F-type H+-transporting ATPase subunit gamma
MSMIAASKMRRSQEMASRGRPYSDRMRDLLSHLSAQPRDEENVHPLLRQREVRRVGVVHITPDRGLTGGLNSNINRSIAQFIVDSKNPSDIVAVGKKGRDFLSRGGQKVKAAFSDLGDRPSLLDTTPISSIVIQDYTHENLDSVYISYAKFISTTVQTPVVYPLLPVIPSELRPEDSVGYIYEPSSDEVLSNLLPRYVEMQIYHAILESIASEQSARMVAMQSATDSANEMIDDLTLVMNKARQESITTELLDIVSGAMAVEA